MTKRTLGTVIAILFVVSGATGLIYQIVWFKYLSLFLGNTTYAQAVVLATFMGGLAIGASLWGRSADRAAKPLRIYALLEIGIAFYCLLYPSLLSLVKRAFIGIVIASDLPSDGTSVLLLKLLTSLSTLLLPTILMGGTLPVLVKFLTDRIEESGKTVATLYFVNSFGAVVGSMLGGFFLIQSFGLNATIYVAAVINLTVGLAALLLGRLEPSSMIIKAAVREEAPSVEFTQRQVTLAVFVAGLSGIAAMIYEVAWVRLLIPILGSSTYSFTLMLVAFISGITFGSWLVGAILHKIKNLFGFLAVCQMGVAVSLLATLPLYARVPYYFWHVAHILMRSESTYPLFLGIQFLFGFLVMFVPTVFLGMTLPVASRIASRSIAILGRTIGNVFSINTLGTVIGALAAGLVLIPAIGVKHTIEVGIFLNVAASFVILSADKKSASWKENLLVVAVILTAALSVFTGAQWNKLIMISGVFRHINGNATPPPDYAAFEAMTADDNILYYKEGPSATVAAVDGPYFVGRQKVLFINGKPDASSKGDLPTQVLLVQLPMMLHPMPLDVCVVGLGSGVSLGSVLTHPVRSVDCVEIAPEVVEASAQFNDVNNRPLQDPRSHLYVDDALSFLKLTNNLYDVIVSEPTNPWIAGVGNLFTHEFFEKCHEHLNPGGMMVQWFHLYEMDDETVRLVLRTFRSTFQNVTIWQSWTNDIILLGSDQPIALDAEKLNNKFTILAVRHDLYRINVANPATLLSLQMVSEKNTAEFAAFGEINTEDLPLLEYRAPRSFFINRGVAELAKYDERMIGSSAKGDLMLQRYQEQSGLSDEQKRSIGIFHSTADGGNLALGYSLLQEYVAKHPGDIDVIQLLADVARRAGRKEEKIRYLKQLTLLRPNDPTILAQYALEKHQSQRPLMSRIAQVNIDESEKLLQRCIEISADTVDRFHVVLGDVYTDVWDYLHALEHYRRALEIREKFGATDKLSQDGLLVKYAHALQRSGDDTNALAYAMQALKLNPDNRDAKAAVYTLYMKRTNGLPVKN